MRLYDTQRDWQLRKDVTTRMTRWTITDTCLSPDQRLLVYASISPVAFVVHVGSSGDQVCNSLDIASLCVHCRVASSPVGCWQNLKLQWDAGCGGQRSVLVGKPAAG